MLFTGNQKISVGEDVNHRHRNAAGEGVVVSRLTLAAEGVGAAAEAAPSVFESVGSLLNMANGGSVRKQNAYAMGGLAGNTVAKSNQIDGNDTLAKMDASDSMSVAKMGTTSNKNSVGAPETHAKHISSETGRTDGMSESSSNDPDGFGKEGADNRHLAGKATMSVVGYATGTPFLGLAADAIHPIMEPVTREMINIGDKAGGVAGAMVTDPAGAIASGKYSNKDLLKGAGLALSGNAWAGKFLAKGGRVDHTDGGDVQGPGTETSDDIPAWLSDGEYVLNAEAVKMVGKDKLEQINNAGLAKRENKFACGGGVKKGIKLAGGGFLGGNLGIAMGAGVDQWNKQQVIDQRDKEIEIHQQQADAAKEKMGWERVDREQKDLLRNTMVDIGKETTAMTDPSAHIAKSQDEAKASAALRGEEYAPLTAEQTAVINQGYAPARKGEVAQMQANKLRTIGKLAEADAIDRVAVADSKQEEQDQFVRDFRNLAPDTPLKKQLEAFGKIDPKTALTQGVELQKAEEVNKLRRETAEENARTRKYVADSVAASKAAGGEGRSGASGKSGKKSSDGMFDDKEVLDYMKTFVPESGGTPILRKIGDKEVQVSPEELRSEVLTNVSMFNGSGMPVGEAVSAAYNMSANRMSGKGNDYLPIATFDQKTGKVLASVTNQNGRTYQIGGGRDLSDSELKRIKGGDSVIQARDKYRAESVAMMFEQVKNDPEKKQAFMRQYRIADDDAFENQRAIALAAAEKFDPVAQEIEAGIAKSQGVKLVKNGDGTTSLSGKKQLPTAPIGDTTTRADKAWGTVRNWGAKRLGDVVGIPSNLESVVQKSSDFLLKDQVPR